MNTKPTFSSAKKFSTPKHNLTVQPGSSSKGLLKPKETHKSTCRNNLNITHFNPTTKTKTDMIDWNLECEFVSSEYLRALIMEQVTVEECRECAVALNDQLSLENNFLLKLKNQKRNMDTKLFDLQTLMQTETSLSILSDVTKSLNNLTSQKDLLYIINSVYDKLSAIYNSIEMKNIKAFRTQDQYEQLIILIGKCDDAVNKIICINNNMEEVKQLAKCLDVNRELKKSIMKELHALTASEEIVTYHTLKKFSDNLST